MSWNTAGISERYIHSGWPGIFRKGKQRKRTAMMSGKEDMLSVLSEAFLMEKGSKIFYAEAAEKSVNADARNTFQYLSEWEDEHMDYVLSLYKAIVEDWSMVTFEEFKRTANTNVTEAGISLKEMESKIERYSFTDEMGALTLAMEIEGKAYTMYRRLSEEAADADAKVVFREMMDQEMKHIEHLKGLRARLADVYKP
jgi:rubrerythrin